MRAFSLQRWFQGETISLVPISWDLQLELGEAFKQQYRGTRWVSNTEKIKYAGRFWGRMICGGGLLTRKLVHTDRGSTGWPPRRCPEPTVPLEFQVKLAAVLLYCDH